MRPHYSTVNETFFSVIDTEEKAYYLGLMGADGYVSTKGDYVALKLSGDDDSYLLERLRQLLGTTYPVNKEKPHHSNVLAPYRLRISSKILRDDLIRHGIVPTKTLTYQLNTSIRPDLIRHYVRGYVDGDGSISACKHNAFNVTIVSSIPFANQLHELLLHELDLNSHVQTREGRSYSSLCLGGSFSCFRFLHWIYDGCTISMNRKHAKYDLCRQAVVDRINHPHLFYPRHGSSDVMQSVERCCQLLEMPFVATRYNGLSSSDDEQRQVISLYSSGLSIPKVCSALPGRARPFVTNILKVHGIQIRPPNQKPQPALSCL